jgi:ParB-like chromosome segregation protein Spo0J
MKQVPLKDIKSNPNNPRVIKDEKFVKLVQSLKDLPEMATVRPIVVNQDMVVLGGNMRLKAMKEAGWKEAPVEVVDWDEDKQRQFIIKDNVGFGEWDWEMLANEWDAQELDDWGLDVPKFAEEAAQNDLSEKLRPTFRIEIYCNDEEHQEKIYNKLIAEGYECRLLTL